jgi:hypothetical protein
LFRKHKVVIFGKFSIKSGGFMLLTPKGSDTGSEWGMDEFTNLGRTDLSLRRVYRRDERWKDEQRRRQSSPGMKEKMLARLRARLASVPALLEKNEREVDLVFAKYWNQ